MPLETAMNGPQELKKRIYLIVQTAAAAAGDEVLTSDVVRITHQKGHWTSGPPRTEERSEDITLTW
jgi:hypothetical protein